MGSHSRLRFFAALLIVACAAQPIAAQGVAASPALVMLKGQPGQSTTQTLTVTNTTAAPMAFDMVAKDIIVRDGKRVWMDAGEIAGSIAATAVFSPKSVVVPPGSSQQVDVHVTIPPKPGARAMLAMFRGTTKYSAGQASVTASLGIILMFTLSDNAAIRTTAAVIQPPTASKNLTISQQVINSGTEPVAPKAMLAILNRAGRLVGRTPIALNRLLPGEQAELRSDYAGDLPPGSYRALITYDLGGKIVASSADFNVK